MKIEFYHNPEVFKGPVNLKIDGEWKTLQQVDENTIEIIFRKLLMNVSAAISIRLIASENNLVDHRLILLRFIQCNWGSLDNVMDIDSNDNYYFEKVKCDIRKSCKHNGVICLKV